MLVAAVCYVLLSNKMAPVFGFAAAAACWRQQCSFSLSSIIFCNVIFALLSSDLISAALNYDWEILLTL